MHKKIKLLEEKILQAKQDYYNHESVISDEEYDLLEEELRQEDPNNLLLESVGFSPSEEWKKIKHQLPLGSLNKVHSIQELEKWVDLLALGKQQVLCVTEKIDGLSIGLQYEKGHLVSAALRGNGLEGENILQNVLLMKGVRQKLNSDFSGLIRGEILLYESIKKQHFPDKANPRNAASGICRRLDGDGCQHLDIICYQVLDSNIKFDTDFDQISFLSHLGFSVPNYLISSSYSEIENFYNFKLNNRDKLDYWIDGLVISINNNDIQKSLGYTNLYPKSKVALKFPNVFAKAVIKKIEWTVGTIGHITPKAWFEPTDLLGSVVEKASIYNLSYLKEKQINIGATVLICKSGEIIPRVEKVLIPNGEYQDIPTHCPSCNSKIVESGEYLLCKNYNCREQKIRRIIFWIKTLSILEWGRSLIEKLVDSGKVNNIADLYSLSKDDLLQLERIKDKTATKCYDLLWNRSCISPDLLIGGLCIPLIGVKTISLIINSGYSTLEQIQSLTIEELVKIDGLGEEKATALFNGLQKNKELINTLLSKGITMETIFKPDNNSGKLTGVSFVFTGTMRNKRKDLQQKAVAIGAEVRNTVSKGTTYLVIADPHSESSKAANARKFGTKLISEEEFLEIVK